jgi:hypothetical protein
MAASYSVSPRNLSEAEQRAFAYFTNHGLQKIASNITAAEELLAFFLRMRDEQGANADNAPVQHPIYVQLELAHYFLTRYCNILGPRVDQKKYPPLPHRALRVPGMSWAMVMHQAWEKFDQLPSALAPECETIEAAAATLNVQHAEAASPPATALGGPSPSAVRANLHMFATDQGGRHTPVFPSGPYRPQLIPKGTNEKLNAEITGNFAPISPGTSAMVGVRLEDGRALNRGDRFVVWEEETDPDLIKFGAKGLGAVGELEVA